MIIFRQIYNIKNPLMNKVTLPIFLDSDSIRLIN